jgi:large subunit ribosomal protein L29
MKASDMRDLDGQELNKRLVELRKEVFGLRFSNATGELDDTAGIARARRDLARALTVAHERELAAPQRAISRQLPTSEMRTDG